MTINLSSYTSIQSNLFVRIEVPEYTTDGVTFTSEVLRFSDLNTSYTINDEVYLGAGNLLSITSSTSELRPSGSDVTISLSGIPNTSIAEIVKSKIKGCAVRIYRVLFDASTGEYLDIEGNPLGRFRGFVNNFSLTEEWDNLTRTSSNTIVLTCSSSASVLQNKVSGRKTNPESQKKFFPNDLSMDRVPNLENSTFNFGAPQ